MTKEKLPKVEDMIDDENVSQYDGELSELIKSYNEEIQKVKDDIELSNVAFFDMGKKLIEVEKKIQHANEATPKKAKKIFAAFKLRVSKQINKNISNVDKVFKVAQFCETETYRKYKNSLPSSWGTLYLLLSLKDDKKEIDVTKIDELMSDTEITKDIKRADFIRKIEKIKNPDKTDKTSMIIEVEGGYELPQDELHNLQKYLNRKFSNKLKIIKPKVVISKNSDSPTTEDLPEQLNDENKTSQAS